VIVLDLFDIYVLNLVVTVAMFTVLVFRAWVEHKNYKLMWRELEWRRTCETAGKILKAEKTLFTKVEGGEELYELLTNLFSNNK
jgi:ketopantoate hydroxymethyltransferase